ncbi:MAG: hypothetical protein ACLUE2_01680 [Bacteroides cellulosilyticus]
MMNDFFSNKLRLLKFILLSIALGNFFISEGYATTKSVVITQQEKTVKGKVTDDNDEPLIGCQYGLPVRVQALLLTLMECFS